MSNNNDHLTCVSPDHLLVSSEQVWAAWLLCLAVTLDLFPLPCSQTLSLDLLTSLRPDVLGDNHCELSQPLCSQENACLSCRNYTVWGYFLFSACNLKCSVNNLGIYCRAQWYAALHFFTFTHCFPLDFLPSKNVLILIFCFWFFYSPPHEFWVCFFLPSCSCFHHYWWFIKHLTSSGFHYSVAFLFSFPTPLFFFYPQLYFWCPFPFFLHLCPLQKTNCPYRAKEEALESIWKERVWPPTPQDSIVLHWFVMSSFWQTQ